jgi:exopolyphosphatase / guanosine-5'-triphosphate,3'-diphosphate pyrophosphatase
VRIAAIDIGTNSLHMIIAKIRPDLSFEIIDREKEMVRLGAGGLDGRALMPEVTQSALLVLSKFRRLAESHAVDEVVAVATSAVREAENGGAFLKAVTRQTGIRARVISGTEEANLIYRAATYALGLAHESAVVIDIGGGSVEVARGVGPNVESGRSFKAGVIRLTERFITDDPLRPADERRMLRFLRAELREHLAEVAGRGFDRVIGTSGTILSLGAVALAPDERRAASLRNRRIPAAEIRRIRDRLVRLPLQKRLRVAGLDPRRADLIVTGAVLLDFMLKRLGAREITLCDVSLREGLVLDYIARHRKEIAQAERYPDVRRRSVIELAEKCRYWPEHAQHVIALALALFDGTRSVHKLTDREREWLEYAAMLHDIGTLISYEQHHLHSYYLIKHADLRGFDPAEIDTIALIARYHRRTAPKRRDDIFGAYDRAQRRTVRTLAAILRLAENLDRSHSQVVTGVELHDRHDDWMLLLRTGGDAELELWSAIRQRAAFEKMIGKPLFIEVSRQTERRKAR